MREDIIEQGVYFYEKVRATQLAAQYMTFDWLMGFFPGTQRVSKRQNPELFRALQVSLNELLHADAKLFSTGLLPLSLLWPKEKKFTDFLKNYPRLFRDGWKIYRRRKNNGSKDFSPEAKEAAAQNDVPEYYRRNFHFQSDGYFSEESARLYDREVDLLFAGATDAMRRLMVSPILKLINPKSGTHPRGKGLRFLELGCGTGSATPILAQLFPAAEITAVDLSPHYLKHARGRLTRFLNVHALRADASSLPFHSDRFDLIYSTFLFHELPLEVRQSVLQEARRVGREGCVLAIVDSVQRGDSTLFDELLEDFPKNFHEPFFKNYATHPMSPIIEQAGFTVKSETVGFASKAWTARLDHKN